MKTLDEFDRFLRSTVLRTTFDLGGWNLTIQDPSIAFEPQTYVYVHDHLSGWTWMAGIDRRAFPHIASIGENLNASDTGMVRGALLGAASIVESGNESKTPDTERCLAYSVALYAGGTKTFQAANRFSDGGHFCVVLYRSSNDKAIANLRPCAFPPSDGGALSADVFKAHMRRVVAHDRQNNPQWIAC